MAGIHAVRSIKRIVETQLRPARKSVLAIPPVHHERSPTAVPWVGTRLDLRPSMARSEPLARPLSLSGRYFVIVPILAGNKL